MTEAEIGWCAGILDGEGSITISRLKWGRSKTPQHCVRVDIALIHMQPLEFLREHFGGSICKVKKTREHHHQAYRWHISSRKAQVFLELVIPHLRIKRSRAILALELQGSINCYEQKYSQRGRIPVEPQEIRYRDWVRERLLAL